MTQEDIDREYRIDVEMLKLKYAKTQEERRIAYDQMVSEIKQRSPAQIERMERARGLV